MTKKGFLVLMVVFLLSLSAIPAFAGYNWCYDEPPVTLPNGNIVNIDVGVPAGHESDTLFLFIRAPRGSHLGQDDGNFPGMRIFFSPTARGNHLTVVAVPSGMYPVKLVISENGKTLGQKIGHPGQAVRLHVHVK